MNNDIKTARFYSPSKMRRAIMLMEQFWLLSVSKELSEKDRTCATKLFEHYRRLVMCILMKDMPEQLMDDLVIDVEYMKDMYKKYSI